ncbi:uncharacterized protein LOC124285937 [Haliotis rubra]|uniref:uncharacterized protein LOC124285937 n=1 Tax=Haliotis rubra TaxID=36100 RepID=UPI001EE52C03|nr:uncharacterized protein LOC124285937 [Haliotis rubra]
MFHFENENQNNFNLPSGDDEISGNGLSFLDEEGNQTDNNSTRKRKVDEEGFVHPTTPDIPKSSIRYGLPSKPFGFEKLISNNQDIPAEGRGRQNSDFDEIGGESNNVRRDDDESVISSEDTNASENTCVGVYNKASDSDSEVDKLTKNEKVSELIKELSADARMVTKQFAETFEDCENYETFCVSQLDQLISDAIRLEETLKNQKDALRQRLGFISRTLQEM